MSKSHTGGRTGFSTKVLLNVYDLHDQNEFLHGIGFGMYHSGVEVSGREYSFAGGAGIFDITPKTAPAAKFREQITIGHFDGGKDDLNKALDALRDEYGPDDYHGLRRNCNHFSSALCWRLLQIRIPPHVNRAAEMAVCCCGCLIPQRLEGDGPVKDPNNPANPSSSGFLLPKKQEITRPVFTGSGNRLGAASSSSISNGGSSFWNSSATANPQDDLTDRREKARKAALARLGKSQQD